MTTKILSERQWQLLANAERPLYAGDNVGAHAFTDIMTRDESGPLVDMWDAAFTNASAIATGSDDEIDLEASRRVAAAQAVLAFGSDGFMVQPETTALYDLRRTQERFDVALGNFLVEHAPAGGDVTWNVRAEYAGGWEVALIVDGEDAGTWAITETTAERIDEHAPADLENGPSADDVPAPDDDAGELPAGLGYDNLTEAERERVIDRRVQARLATDAAYRNAENADEQAAREDEIEEQEIARLEGRRLERLEQARRDGAPLCRRCGERPVTRHLEWRNGGEHVTVTERCERCAQDLREYVALPGIGATIVIDRPAVDETGTVRS